METLVLIALFSPLVGSLFASFFGMSPKNKAVGVVTSGLIFASLYASIQLFNVVWTGKAIHITLFDWINAGGVNIAFGIVVDSVSVIMMMVVGTVSSLVHVYSMGYMAHDRAYNRFFAYLSAFVFSMLILVMSDNFAGLFIGWEGVGLCSWLLIGFWYEKHSATWAANEAFIMNRIADLGMLLGIFLIYWTFGSVNYDVVFSNLHSADKAVLILIAALLFIGAMGKSAQFPLHTWLADAMEGPTPVSALIHAATMVTAGVYLVIRSHELFSLVPEVGYIVASLGAFVAFFAASMALVNRDLKRIIAYSTLSQLGYMFVAAGLGYYWVALFHLMTHAFFKALLFLGAGNVMHAMHDELDINKMGGLFKPLKFTAIMMTIASVALAGIYPFAGFFSKDKILEVAFGSGHEFLWFTLLVTAGLTAFYSFRLIMKVFFGNENYKEFFPKLHPHEAYTFMLIAMSPLFILSFVSGFFEHGFLDVIRFILPTQTPEMAHSTEVMLIALTSAIALGGIFVAIYVYTKGLLTERVEQGLIYKLLYNQYFIPYLYEKCITKPYARLSEKAWGTLDLKVVDYLVDLIARKIYSAGENSSTIQSGNLSSMLKWMGLGLLILVILAVLYSPVG